MSYRVQFTISDEQKIKLEEDMRKLVNKLSAIFILSASVNLDIKY